MTISSVPISGKVQGVWFRESTRHQALQLAIDGSVRNLPDGTVEVIAYGSETTLQQLGRWLFQCPPLARVAHVLATS
ncbi:acylphosphatase [Ectothiorhodospiraceae bacterium BW-2]|nr:acylphosphatase [Ectothiorhodospiraceae bacterium BW-2]